jgi:hypothetical protein
VVPKYQVTSLVRNPEGAKIVSGLGATPKVLSIEDDSVDAFADVFKGSKAVVFSAGAGGKGGKERTRKVCVVLQSIEY